MFLSFYIFFEFEKENVEYNLSKCQPRKSNACTWGL